MNPEGHSLIRINWRGGVHSQDIGINSCGKEYDGEDGNDTHFFVYLIGKERFICVLKGFDCFLGALEGVPKSDVGADKILKKRS